MSAVTHAYFTVWGDPPVKLRARRGKGGRWYTPAKTVEGEDRVRQAWIAEGRPTLAGAVVLSVVAYLRRPKDHWTGTGSPSAKARREPHPIGRPDADNIAKAVADALGGFAVSNDSRIVDIRACKRWAIDRPFTTVQLTTLTEAA